MKIAVFISGSGTTLRNLIAHRQQGKLSVEIGLVVSSSGQAAGLAYADGAGIPTAVIEAKTYRTPESFSELAFAECRQRQITWVVLGGFLRRLAIPADFQNRVINIHPSLIPAFCGHGYYGAKVHQAVIDYGCRISGCTVHLVDDEFDHGPILAQSAVPVLPTDSAASLAARVFAEECELYPRVINQLAQATPDVVGRQVHWNWVDTPNTNVTVETKR